MQIDDVEGGVALRYQTSAPDQVGDVRARVAQIAERMNAGVTAKHAHMGKAHHLDVPAVASVEEASSGALLVLRPSDPTQLEALRAEVREHPPSNVCGCADSEHAMHHSQQ